MAGKAIDLTNQVFGRLTVISFDETRSIKGRTYWKCLCSCGSNNKVSIRADILKDGKTQSCGCLRTGRINKKIRVGLDEIGNKYGFLTIIEILPVVHGKRIQYLCKCDCENPKPKKVNRDKLIGNHTRSCGCLNIRTCKKMGGNNKISSGEACFNSLYINYKTSAKQRNLSFNLEKNDFRKLTKSNCYYCGVEPKQIKKAKNTNGDYLYNGIDRINNNVGYIIENCVSCCGRCNEAKMTQTQENFINWIEKAYNNLFSKKGDD